MDWKLIVYGAWAAGSLIAWGIVFHDTLGEYRELRRQGKQDRRGQTSSQQLFSDLGLLLTAVASALAIFTLVVGQEIPGIRGFALAVALGGFLGAGIVRVSSRRRR